MKCVLIDNGERYSDWNVKYVVVFDEVKYPDAVSIAQVELAQYADRLEAAQKPYLEEHNSWSKEFYKWPDIPAENMFKMKAIDGNRIEMVAKMNKDFEAKMFEQYGFYMFADFEVV